MKRATLMALAVLIFAALAILSRCTPSTVQREAARAAVVTLSAAVHEADVECARVVRATSDRALGERCDAGYVAARATLIVAATGVDAWSAPEARTHVTCAVVNVARELAIMSRVIAASGGRSLPIVDDAIALASSLGVCTSRDGAP